MNVADKDGWSALHHAAREGYKEVVRLLIDNGADVSSIDKNGWSALHHAVYTGHLEVVRLLIDGGADMNIAVMAGFNVTHISSSVDKQSHYL